MSDFPVSGLVSPEILHAVLGRPDLVILDIRSAADGGRAAFEAGHIPGAVHSDYAADGWRAKVGNAPGKGPKAWWDNSSCRNPDFHLPDLGLPADLRVSRLKDRAALLRKLDRFRHDLDTHPGARDLDVYRRQAMELLLKRIMEPKRPPVTVRLRPELVIRRST